MSGIPVIPGTQVVTRNGTQDEANSGVVLLPNGQGLSVSACTPCVSCPKLSGWAIAGIVVVALVLLAVLGMAIAAIVMKTRTMQCSQGPPPPAAANR